MEIKRIKISFNTLKAIWNAFLGFKEKNKVTAYHVKLGASFPAWYRNGHCEREPIHSFDRENLLT